jgi:DNA-binding beta-propeller fold protein YncE
MKQIHFPIGITAISFLLAISIAFGSGQAVPQENQKPASQNGKNGKQSRYVFAATTSERFIANEKNVFVIDLLKAATDPSRATVALIPTLARRLAFTSDGSLCLACNDQTPQLTVIDAEKAPGSPTESILARIPLKAPPSGLVISGGRPQAFVAENGQKSLEIIDIRNALEKREPAVVATIHCKYPVSGLALSPDDRYLFIIEKKIHVLLVEKLQKKEEGPEVASWEPPFPPGCVMTGSDSSVLYSQDISRVVLTFARLEQILSNPKKVEYVSGRTALNESESASKKDWKDPEETLSLCPGTPYLFITHPTLGRLSIVNMDRLRNGEKQWGEARIAAGKVPLQACFTSDGTTAVVNNYLSGNLYIYSVKKCLEDPENALTAKVAVPSPRFIAVKPDRKNNHENGSQQ